MKHFPLHFHKWKLISEVGRGGANSRTYKCTTCDEIKNTWIPWGADKEMEILSQEEIEKRVWVRINVALLILFLIVIFVVNRNI